MFGSEQAKRLKQTMEMVKNPGESEMMQALATVIATHEHEQIERVEELHDAVGIEGIERTRDVDDRKEQLLGLIEAMAGGDIGSYWLDEVASEHIENADDAAPYLGMEADDWEQQIEQWAEQYRQRSDEAADYTDRELADTHVSSKWGVSLGEFEEEIIDWTAGEALETMLSGNLKAVSTGIEAATEELESQ